MPYLFILLNVADAILTLLGIVRGKTELNPVANLLMEQIGVLPAVLLVKMVSVAVVLAVAVRLPILLHIGCVAVTAAVVWNLTVLLS